MVPCVRLGISNCFWLHSVEGEENHELVSCSQKCMVPCIRLGTSNCFWLHSVEGEENHGLVSCISEKYGAKYKARYLQLLLVTFCGRLGEP